MSKSRGTFYTAKEFAEKYPPEFLRYYYASMLSKKVADIDLNFNDFMSKINNEIIGNISNFCYRVLTFIHKYQDGKIGSFNPEGEKEKETITKTEETIQKIKKNYSEFNFKEAVKEIMGLSHTANQYFQQKEPWKMQKGKKLDNVLCFSLNLAKNIAITLKPILPELSENILKQLNLDPELKWKDIGFNIKNHTAGFPTHLAQKIETKESAGKEEQKEEFPLNLRIGLIETAEKHPESDKLVILQVNLGEEKRQIIAGIQQYYELDELKGIKIAVVTNLKKAKLGGLASDGMLLAAGENARLLHPEGEPGEQIFIGDKEKYSYKTGRIEYSKFQKIKMKTKDNKVIVNGQDVLKTLKGDVYVDVQDGEEVG